MSRTKASVEVSSHITMEVARVTHCSIRLNIDIERLKIDKVMTTIACKHAYTENQVTRRYLCFKRYIEAFGIANMYSASKVQKAAYILLFKHWFPLLIA